jgi:hypothetical protein
VINALKPLAGSSPGVFEGVGGLVLGAVPVFLAPVFAIFCLLHPAKTNTQANAIKIKDSLTFMLKTPSLLSESDPNTGS